MLSMWKVIDPFCGCAAYYTDQEENFDLARLQRHLAIIERAIPAVVIVDGQEASLWKLTWESVDGRGGVQYWSEEELKWGKEFCRRHLEAHQNKVRVEVTAKEFKSNANAASGSSSKKSLTQVRS